METENRRHLLGAARLIGASGGAMIGESIGLVISTLNPKP